MKVGRSTQCRVIDRVGPHFKVEAIGFTDLFYLLPSEMRGATVGDLVTVTYYSTATRGWHAVSRVFPKLESAPHEHE